MTVIRTIVAFTLIWTTLLFLAPPFVVACLFDRGGIRTYGVQFLFIRLVLLYAGIKVRVQGCEKLVPGEPCILMPNHRSYFDIPALLAGVYPNQVRFVAKRELARLPLLGPAIRYGGHILIERDNREKAIRTLREFAHRFTGAFSIVVFPEGTRSPDTNLLRFKRGGFYLARELKAPIFPVSIRGTQKIMGKRDRWLHPGTVTVEIHDPIDPDAYPSNDDLTQVVRESIESGLRDENGEPALTAWRAL